MARDPLGLLGQLIDGQVRLEAPVGEGGFSVVYRATHLGLAEAVAVKCLKLQASLDRESNETFARRFRDESRLLFRLGQGNLDIVRCLTSATTTSPVTGAMVPYMVLEWLEGQSLAGDFRERKKAGMRGRTLPEVLALLEPAALALDHAHRQGVVHRDVKPANLFLAIPRGGVKRIKVLDFGLAKILDETIGITMAATLGNYMVCSPRYAAPEQFDPKIGAIGPWTDVLSLALVVLEALRDERVRKSEGMATCMTEALDRNARITTRALGLDLPPDVARVLERAVTLDVALRPQSAGELWTELTRAAREAVPAPRAPSSGGDWARTTLDPPRTGPIPGAPLGLGGTVVMSHPSAQTPQPPGALARTAPLGQPSRPQAVFSSVPPPHSAPVPAPTPRPPMASAPRVVSSSPMVSPVPPSAPSVPSTSSAVPSSKRAPRSSVPLVVLLLIVLAATVAGGLLGWRVWRARRAAQLSEIMAPGVNAATVALC